MNGGREMHYIKEMCTWGSLLIIFVLGLAIGLGSCFIKETSNKASRMEARMLAVEATLNDIAAELDINLERAE